MRQEPIADVHPLDQHRDPSSAAMVRELAAGVAARYGGELTRMRRANGYSNATWVGDGIAVRIAHGPVSMARDGAEERVEDWRPCRLLADLLDADGGYLAPLLT